MADLSDDEKAVLRALSELEPATLEDIASQTGLDSARVKQILNGLAKKGLLTSLDGKQSDEGKEDSEAA